MKNIFFLIISFYGAHLCLAQHVLQRKMLLMGSDFEITVVAHNKAIAKEYIDIAISEINRIESLISSWKSDSETTQINSQAGIAPVKVSKELYDLIERCLMLSKLTNGAFDITYASMDSIWSFDGNMKKLPDNEHLKHAIRNVGYEKLKLFPETQSVFLTQKGMKIGFGAIGKGYTADCAKALLQSKGVASGIINASGDMNCWGKQPNGKDWKVAIKNPMNKKKIFAYFPLNNQSVVTSGNYEKYVIFDGNRYSHIIDPRTGLPTKELASCTIFAPKSEVADALATAVFVMGTETGLHFINQLPNIECILVDMDGKRFYSDHIDQQKL